MCFARGLAVLSRFRGLPQDMAVPSRCRRRESQKNVNIKKDHRLVRFFADNYFETETDYAENTRKSLIPEKVVCELYFQLVVVPERFDFSV